MSIAEVLNWILTIFYTIMISTFITVIPFLLLLKMRRLNKLERSIKKMIEKGVPLEPKDIVILGKAFKLGPKTSREPIYSLLSGCDTIDKFEQIKKLITAIEKEEPFDDMPDEVKPSLSRISKLIEASGNESDQHLLLPLHKSLSHYVELKLESDKIKTRVRLSILIAVVSIIIGALSFNQSLKSPTIDDIKLIFDNTQETVAEDSIQVE